MPTEIDNAWAAGIMDGEGYACLIQFPQREGTSWAGHVGVNNTDPRMLRKLQECYGGKISRMSEPPTYAKIKGNKPVFTWRLNGRFAEPFLRMILPHLVCKKDQAEVYLLYVETLRPKKYSFARKTDDNTISERRAMYESLRALKAEVHA
jgi:hypothetical protein